ncbi:RNB domain containing protein [Pyrenophora tritici-repentis]|nr:RNB domain containing protein [Pyrenophora tritici-repentis]
MYTRLQSAPSYACLRCQWRLLNQRSSIRQIHSRQALCSIKVSQHTSRRALHTTTNRTHISSISSTSAPPPPFDPTLLPHSTGVRFREHLEKWQELYGAPTKEALSGFQNHPARGDIQNGLSKLTSAFKADEDARPDELAGAEEDEEEDPITIGLFLKPGDVVELCQPDREAVLAVFVQQLENDSQFFSVNGRWTHNALSKVSFAIPGCIDPELVLPLLPFLPTNPSKADPKGQVHVPRELAAPITDTLVDMTREAETIYRNNAAELDTAYENLAEKNKPTIMTLTQIAKRLLGRGDSAWVPSPAALLAVRKALNRNEFRFRSDSRSHRLTNSFTIRPKNDVEIVETVHGWIREYREYLALEAKQPKNAQYARTNGVIHITDFLEKARKLIAYSRRYREPNTGGVGPWTGPLIHKGAPYLRPKPTAAFTESDQKIIDFLQAWVLTDQFTGMAGLHAACASLVLASECYGPGVIRDAGTTDEALSSIKPATGFLFLQEIGVLLPHQNRAIYNEHLMLPTVRPTRNLELLNEKAELTRRNPDFRDSMVHLRRDWGSTTIYCIDDADAHEIDDGISIERVQGADSEFWIHVHVANPTAFFDKTHTLSGLAAHMTETVYTPERFFPMLPEWANEEHFSLKRNRPVITFSSRINRTGNVLERKVQHGMVQNVVSITYSQVAKLLGDDSTVETRTLVVGGTVPNRKPPKLPNLSPGQLKDLDDLYTAAKALWEARKAAGGVRFSPGNTSVRVWENPAQEGLPWRSPSVQQARVIRGDPIIQLTNTIPQGFMQLDLRPKNIVEEMMLLACQTAATWCAERHIPVMYRGTVEPPSVEELSAGELQELIQLHYEKHGKVPLDLTARCQKALGRAIAHFSPLPHKIMGVPSYVKVTSPLRRYSDMMAHWQIEAALRYEAESGMKFDATAASATSRNLLPFSLRQMRESIVTLSPRERIISMAKRDSVNYWCVQALLRAFKYKQAPLPETFRFWVQRVRDGRGALGRLPEYGLTAYVMEESDVQAGDEWDVMLDRMDLFSRTIFVKPCDRTKPCSACCVRGSPRDCHFIAEDGNYTPIRQSYELRKLRAENLRLKERLHSLRIPVDSEDAAHAQAVDSQFGEKPPSWHKRKQQSFQASESCDNIYFGSPGLATVINEFASTNTSISTTLAHVMPQPADMFATGNSSTYPFATIFSASLEDCIPQLLGCLPAKDDMLRYLSAFEKQVCTQIPVEITKTEVERFLSRAKENSQQCPAMLGLLLAVIALGAQHSVWGRNSESWDADVMRAETRAGNVYIAAAMQALRLASFMHKPSLLAIQVLVMIGKYLINSGKYLDAFTLFGTTIRLAHSIGLHCHPKYLDPSPSTARDITTRQRIWWYMLRVDEEFSVTLGRPLGISGIGTCCWPQELTTDPNIVRFGEYINHFTLLARQILSSDRLTNPRIDEFTDALRALSETLPETLRFDNLWANSDIDLPLGSWPLSAMAVGQQAFNSCMILLLDAIERRTITFGSSKAEEALHVFRILKDNNVHKFAGCAVDRIEKGLKELHDTVTKTNNDDHHAKFQQGNNIILSGAAQNKAESGSGGVETVMGRTGMLLIEGAGLQAFVKEEFSPTIWGPPCLARDSKGELYTSSYHSEAIQTSELKAETILVNERAGSLSSLGLDVLTKPNELSAQCALASRASLGIGARSVSLLSLVGWGGWKLGAEGLGGGAISR